MSFYGDHGRAQNPHRCGMMVPERGMNFPDFLQCKRKWTVKVGGKRYCTVHNPAKVAERDAARQAKFDAKMSGYLRQHTAAVHAAEFAKLIDEVLALISWERHADWAERARAALEAYRKNCGK